MSENTTTTTPADGYVTLDGLSKSYDGVAAVDDVTIRLDRGATLALLGPSGCGKSTTLGMVSGFVTPDRGRVVIDGADVTGRPPHRRNTAIVLQSYGLFPHMTVKDNVEFGLRARKSLRSDRGRRVSQALDLVNMADFAHRRPGELSGGQQQRVALARAVAVEPAVLLLDEPMSSLDAKLRVQTRRELKSLLQHLGVTTVIVTHDQNEGLALADVLAVMKDGRIQQLGTPTEIYDAPANEFVATFLGDACLFDAEVVDVRDDGVVLRAAGTVLTCRPTPSLRPGDTVRVVLRPEHVELGEEVGDEAAAGGTADQGITGTVLHREFLGATVKYELTTPFGKIIAGVPPELAPHAHEGDRVAIRLQKGVSYAYRPETAER